MPGKRKRSEELAKRKRKRKRCEELAKRNRKGKTNTKTCQSVGLPKVVNLGRVVYKDDPYSRLSDDIIVSHILTRLSFREAVKTSVLCRRWRNLWTATIGSKLIFSYLITKDDFCRAGISPVLEVVKPTNDDLTVRFNFNSPSCYQAINRWVEIALTNNVTHLHLDFSSPFDTSTNRYTFPAIHSDTSTGVKYPGIHNLRDVCFKYINVSSEVIECMLSNCPYLESLAVWRSNVKQKIRVCTQSTKLKSLEFVNCRYENIEISAPNLIYLGHGGVYQCLNLVNVPLLSQLYVNTSDSIYRFLRLGTPYYIKCFSQLKSLRLDLDSSEMGRISNYPLEFPKLTQLEQLEVRLTPFFSSLSSYLWLIQLIMAAPFLQKLSFSLKLYWLKENYSCNDNEDDHHKKLLNAIGQLRHQHLKSIEMLNFSGTSSEMELGQHLLNISPSLEQFVVSRRLYKENEKEPSFSKHIRLLVKQYKMQVQEFKKWLPPTAKLLIL